MICINCPAELYYYNNVYMEAEACKWNTDFSNDGALRRDDIDRRTG
jgi:hypothetical protein